LRIAFTVAPMLFGVESAGNIVNLLIDGYASPCATSASCSAR
jgi:hypothetical protein